MEKKRNADVKFAGRGRRVVEYFLDRLWEVVVDEKKEGKEKGAKGRGKEVMGKGKGMLLV